jgi:hypothetical protein
MKNLVSSRSALQDKVECIGQCHGPNTANRILLPPNAAIIPVLLGSYLPSLNSQLYPLAILTLFAPFPDLTDLRTRTLLVSVAYTQFLKTASLKIKLILDNWLQWH